MSHPAHLCTFAAILAMIAMGSALAESTDAPRLPKPRPVLAGEAAEPPADERATLALVDAGVAPLPRPRPSIEPGPEVTDWAEAAESRFKEAMPGREPVTSEPMTVIATTVGPTVDHAPPASVRDLALAAIDSLAPLPRPRPQSEAPVLALLAPPPLVWPPTVVEADDPACPARLRALGVTFAVETPIDPGGQCNVDHPLLVTSLGSGVAIEPKAILNCRTAESLALWVKEALLPAALKHFGAAPTGIVHGSTYVCRPRNNVAGAKISEHAHANAVDIAAIRFADQEAVEIGASVVGSADALFETEIRAASCDYFTTVLGPGSDASHALHFHFDMQKRRGGYRLCELGAPSTVGAP